jgi:oxygen-dependent protoporphyrinogen oxidase
MTRRVAVVGGGLSGLAVSFSLLRRAERDGLGIDLSLWESETRLGGKICTLSREGFRCETGPNGFLDNVPQTLEMVEELGLGDRLLRSTDAARRRYIFSGGRLRALPESPAAFFRSDLLSLRGRLRIVGEYFVPPRKETADGEDETVASFIRRRLGAEALVKLIDPMTSGIYAGDPEAMSMASCFPRVVALERQYGGMIRGMIAKQKEARAAGQKRAPGAGPGGTLMSFENGLQEMIDTLAAALGERKQTGAPVRSLTVTGEGKARQYELTFADGNKISADAVILAVPAYEAAKILEGAVSEAAERLRDIPYSAVSVVHCGYDMEKAGRELDGFGFLIPHAEKRRILGSLWTSSIFRNRAPEGKALLTTILGGARDPLTPHLDEAELHRVVQSELRITMNQQAPPDFSLITRWEKAIPQYLVGHEKRLGEIEEHTRGLPGLFLVGNAYRGIGFNDGIKAALQLAPRVIEHIGSNSPL